MLGIYMLLRMFAVPMVFNAPCWCAGYVGRELARRKSNDGSARVDEV